MASSVPANTTPCPHNQHHTAWLHARLCTFKITITTPDRTTNSTPHGCMQRVRIVFAMPSLHKPHMARWICACCCTPATAETVNAGHSNIVSAGLLPQQTNQTRVCSMSAQTDHKVAKSRCHHWAAGLCWHAGACKRRKARSKHAHDYA
jgi:hypothetical protein